MVIVKNLFFLQEGQTGGLYQGHWLIGLHLPTYLWCETRYEATEKEKGGNTYNAVGEVLKLGKVLGHGAFLSELAKCSDRVIVLRQSETSAQSLEEHRP